jgi:hypothetical protein
MSGITTPRPTVRAIALLAAAIFAGAATGCLRAQARTVPEMPALDAPPPPPRVVDAVVLEASPIESPVRLEPPGEPPRVEAAKPEVQPRPQPTTPEAPPLVEEGPQAPPSPTLLTVPPGGEAELEKAIRALLTRASSNLNNVDYGRLHPDAQAQYDQAKRFINQAEAAIASQNLPFAHNLADKAATLASQLAGR